MGQLNLTTDQVQARLDESFVNKDLYSNNPTLEANEYVTYQGDRYYPVVAGYTCDSATYVTPDLDTANLKKEARISPDSLGDLTNYQAASVADMILGNTVGGQTVICKPNQLWAPSDREGAAFDVVTGEVANGFDIIAHATLPLQFKLRLTTPLKTAFYGMLEDGVADDTAAFDRFLSGFAIVGKGEMKQGGTVKTTAPLSCATSHSYLELNANGSTIKPAFTIAVDEIYNFVLALSNTGLSNASKSVITGLSIDASDTPYFESTVSTDRRGIFGVNLSGFSTNVIDGFYASDMFYGAGIRITEFKSNKLSNITMERVGSKFNPTIDDTSAFDAAGDGIYLGNWVGNATTNIENLQISSYDTKFGRAGVVSEVLGVNDALKHKITIDGGFIHNYQRSIHQEDGGKSIVIFSGLTFSGYSCALFNLGSAANEICYDGKASTFETLPPFAYGGTTGVINLQSSSAASISDSVLNYYAGALERGNLVMSGGEINVGAFNVEYIASSGKCLFSNLSVNASTGSIGDTSGNNSPFEFESVKFNNTNYPTFINIVNLQKATDVRFSGLTVFNNCGYQLVLGGKRAYFNGVEFQINGITADTTMGLTSSNVNIEFDCCYFYSRDGLTTIHGDGMVDYSIKGGELLNILISQINGGGDPDATDLTTYKGAKFVYNDNYGQTVVASTFNPFAVWSNNLFVDKTTAQNITTPTETVNVIITGVGNVIRKTSAFTKL